MSAPGLYLPPNTAYFGSSVQDRYTIGKRRERTMPPTTRTRSQETARQAPRRAPNGALDVAVAPATVAPEPGSVPAKPLKPYPRYRVSVQDYVTFHEQGFLIVRGLVPREDVQELVQHSDDLIHGRIDVPGTEPAAP